MRKAASRPLQVKKQKHQQKRKLCATLVGFDIKALQRCTGSLQRFL
jgi:hypothetical protein